MNKLLNVDPITPINYKNPLNNGLFAWFKGLPTNRGKIWYNLANNNNNAKLFSTDDSNWVNVEGRDCLSLDGEYEGGAFKYNVRIPLGLSFWMYGTKDFTSLPSQCIIGNWGGGIVSELQFSVLANIYQVDMAIWSSDELLHIATDNLSPTTYQWYHIVCNIGPTFFNIYYNSRFASGSNQSEEAPNTNVDILRMPIIGIGCRPLYDMSGIYTGDPRCFGGYIDDIRLFNKVLSAADVKAIYEDSVDSKYETLNYVNRKYFTAVTVELDPYVNNSIYLHLTSHLELNETIELCSWGYAETDNNINLFTSGPIVVDNQDIDLLIGGHTSISFYMSGYETIDESIDLYAKGNYPASNTMYLYAKADGTELNSIITLHTFNSSLGDNGAGSEINLYLCNEDEQSHSLTLYLYNGEAVTDVERSAFLYTVGGGELTTSNVELVAYNAYTSSSSHVDLAVKGDGFFNGYYPASSSLYLYINREDEVSAINMFCEGESFEVNSYLYMSVNSANIMGDQTIEMVVPDVILGSTNSYIKMFAGGMVETLYQIDLVIPEVANPSYPVNSYVNLYTEATYKIDETINMAIPTVGVELAGNMLFYCCHNGGLLNSYIYLYTQSANLLDGSVELSIPAVVDEPTQSINLYGHGY